MTTWRTAVALLGVCAFSTGCTTVVYNKPGTKTADVTQDFFECQESARETTVSRVSSLARTINVVLRNVDTNRESFDRCMDDRGYRSSLPRD